MSPWQSMTFIFGHPCAGTVVTICVPRIFPPHLGDTQVWVTRAPVSGWLVSPYLSSPTPTETVSHWGVLAYYTTPRPPPGWDGDSPFLVRGTMVDDGAQLGESLHTGAAYRVVRGTAQGTRGTTQGSRGTTHLLGIGYIFQNGKTTAHAFRSPWATLPP